MATAPPQDPEQRIEADPDVSGNTAVLEGLSKLTMVVAASSRVILILPLGTMCTSECILGFAGSQDD